MPTSTDAVQYTINFSPVGYNKAKSSIQSNKSMFFVFPKYKRFNSNYFSFIHLLDFMSIASEQLSWLHLDE